MVMLGEGTGERGEAVDESVKKNDTLNSLCSLTSTMVELLTVMLITSTATVAVQVYTPASDVLTELNCSLRVLPVCNGSSKVHLWGAAPCDIAV